MIGALSQDVITAWYLPLWEKRANGLLMYNTELLISCSQQKPHTTSLECLPLALLPGPVLTTARLYLIFGLHLKSICKYIKLPTKGKALPDINWLRMFFTPGQEWAGSTEKIGLQ